MLALNQALIFSFAALLIVLVPGPNMTYVISCTTVHGKRAAVIALVGSNAALITLGLITGAGLNTVIKTFPVFYFILKIVGAFYLFWLAWRNILSSDSRKGSAVRELQYTDKKIFQTGYLTNLLNPKSAVFYLAIMPGFLNSKKYIILQCVQLSFIHAIVCFSVNIVIIYFVARLASKIKAGRKIKNFRKWIMASFFTAFGIRMLLQK